MLLEVISSFVIGIFHRLGQQAGNILADSTRKASRVSPTKADANSDPSDIEVWNIVTSYGKYKDVWPIYRTSGLLEAIKVRDEKAEFDLKMSEIDEMSEINDLKQLNKLSHQKSSHSTHSQSKSSPPVTPNSKIESREVLSEVAPRLIETTQDNLDDLDFALVRGLVSYFEGMPDTIRHYRRDHHASEEEAEVIAGFYKEAAGIIRNVQNRGDVKKLIEYLENLKKKVERYKHESYKYRLSTGLDKEAISKLEKIL